MAKTDGTQNIPSELLDAYRATLGEERPDDGVRKRYPYRVPIMQTKTGRPSPGQRAQRTAFLNAVAKFNALPQADRERWYASMPEWGSLLWYYNWFMLNAIPNLWGTVPGGAAILKSIQNIKDSIPIGGKTVTIPVNVVVAKCVVMLWGSTYAYVSTEEQEAVWWAAGWSVYPVYTNLTVNSIDISWATVPHIAGDVTITIIEYI